jgi:hypothetical protein
MPSSSTEDKPRAGVRAPPGGFAGSDAAQGKGRESGGDLPLGDGGQTHGSSPERPSDDLRGIPPRSGSPQEAVDNG